MKKKHNAIIRGAGMLLMIILFCSWLPSTVMAAEDPFASFLQSNIKRYTATDAEYANRPYLRKLQGAFNADFRILMYGVLQDPAKSTQNPNNDPVGFPNYIGNVDVRPDFRFNTRYLDLIFKPRAMFDYRYWKEGQREGEDDWSDEWYVNEWLVRLKAADRIFLSYGRKTCNGDLLSFILPRIRFSLITAAATPIWKLPEWILPAWCLCPICSGRSLAWSIRIRDVIRLSAPILLRKHTPQK